MATILFCEDNPSIRKLILIAMRDSGHRVLIAPDGDQGLVIALQEHPDLLVTDLAMPIFDGLQLFHAVRSEPSLDRMRIVFLTASTQRGLMSEAKTLAVDALLTKPFSPARLLEQLDAILGAAAPAR